MTTEPITHIEELIEQINQVEAELTARLAGNTLGLFPDDTTNHLTQMLPVLSKEIRDYRLIETNERRDLFLSRKRRAIDKRF